MSDEGYLTPAKLIELLTPKVEEPHGKVLKRQTELVNKRVVKDSLTNEVKHKGKKYVKRIQLVNKYELVETFYELY